MVANAREIQAWANRWSEIKDKRPGRIYVFAKGVEHAIIGNGFHESAGRPGCHDAFECAESQIKEQDITSIIVSKIAFASVAELCAAATKECLK